MKLHCKHCQRYLADVDSFVGEILCSNSNCKATNQFKIVSNNELESLKYKFTNPEKPPKNKENDK